MRHSETLNHEVKYFLKLESYRNINISYDLEGIFNIYTLHAKLKYCTEMLD